MDSRIQCGNDFFNRIERNDFCYLRELIEYFWNSFDNFSLNIDSINVVPIVSWDKRHYLFSLSDGRFLYVEVGIEIDFSKNRLDNLAICYKLFHSLFELSTYPVKYIAFAFVYQEDHDLELINNYGMYNRKAVLEIKRMEDKHYDCGRIEKYKRENNILGDNEFYIINMNMLDYIDDNYSVNEKFLTWILHMHYDIQDFNHFVTLKNYK